MTARNFAESAVMGMIALILVAVVAILSPAAYTNSKVFLEQVSADMPALPAGDDGWTTPTDSAGPISLDEGKYYIPLNETRGKKGACNFGAMLVSSQSSLGVTLRNALNGPEVWLTVPNSGMWYDGLGYWSCDNGQLVQLAG